MATGGIEGGERGGRATWIQSEETAAAPEGNIHRQQFYIEMDTENQEDPGVPLCFCLCGLQCLREYCSGMSLRFMHVHIYGDS